MTGSESPSRRRSSLRWSVPLFTLQLRIIRLMIVMETTDCMSHDCAGPGGRAEGRGTSSVRQQTGSPERHGCQRAHR